MVVKHGFLHHPREEGRLKVFENRILRQIFGPERMGIGEGSTMRHFIVCTVQLIYSGD